MGGGSASDVSVVDSSSLGFKNMQEFADYVLSQIQIKAWANGSYEENFVAHDFFVKTGGGYLIHPPSNSTLLDDLVHIDLDLNYFRICSNCPTSSGGHAVRGFAINFSDIAENTFCYPYTTQNSQACLISPSAPAYSNSLWAY